MDVKEQPRRDRPSRRTGKLSILSILRTVALCLCVSYTVLNIRDFASSSVGGAIKVLSTMAAWFASVTATSDLLGCAYSFSRQHGEYGETVKWESCGEINHHALECSSLTVPMDQFNEVNSGNKTFEIPLIRLRGRDAGPGKNILLNPGGPGGSGLNFMYRKGALLNTIVGEGFHLVSFDPRGINASRPQALCYPDQDTRRDRSPGGVKTSFPDPVRDSGYTFARSENLVQACADTTGEHGAYINTPQTAADMNSILDALGQENLTYWGFSYGTLLGQTYATLFPERVGRVIIDGVANVFDWYDSLLDEEMWTDTDRVFEGFFDECIKAGKNCSLTTLGDTKEELLGMVAQLGLGLREQPLSVYINETHHGLVGFDTIFYTAIFGALYKPEGWHRLADTLTQLLNGNATQALLEYGLESGPSSNDAYSFVLLNDGLTGPKHWPQEREPLLQTILQVFNDSSFAATEDDTYYQKAKWRLPNTHHFKPERHVETAHPLLILSTTYDPVCPLKSARVARDAFKGSRLIEVLGYGHCSVALPSSCLAAHVRAFLNEGKMPEGEGDVQCETDAPYFLPPGSEAAHAHELSGGDEERRGLLEAQMGLARAEGWPEQW